MPIAAPKPCAQCGTLTYKGAYCDKHKKVKQKLADSTRKSSTQRGYGYRWQKLSKAYLKSHTLCACANCQAEIKKQRLLLDLADTKEDNYYLSIKIPSLAANVVDHKKPHRGDMKLFWDRTNWQPMNEICHNKKTATEDGGFTGAKPSIGGAQKSTTFSL